MSARKRLSPMRSRCRGSLSSTSCAAALGGLSLALALSSTAVCETCQSRFRRGDVEGEGDLTITDSLRLLNFLFLAGPAPACEDAADTDDDGRILLTDAVYLLNYLFLGGRALPPPGTECGLDPTPDPLRCLDSPACAEAGEVDTDSDPENCGDCGRRCADLGGPHVALFGCEGGQCFVRRCEEGFADADGLVENGCEARTGAELRPAWVHRLGGVYVEDAAGVAALADGSVWIAGTVSTFTDVESADLACPREVQNVNAGVLLARFDGAGRLAWARFAGGNGRDEVDDLDVLPDGSGFITGTFASGAVFGQGEANETTLMSRGGQDVFLARYNGDGTLRWVRTAGGGFLDWGSGISASPDGSSFVAARFVGEVVVGEGGPNETRLTAIDPPREVNGATVVDSFIARYAPDGSLLWVSQVGGTNGQWIDEVKALDDGSVAIAGNFYENVTLGAGDGAVTLTAREQSDGFVARYLADGAVAWTSAIQTSGQGIPRSLATRTDGSLIVLGEIYANEPEAVFDPGGPRETTLVGSRAFLASYSREDGFLRARGIADGYSIGSSMGTLPDGSTLVVGNIDHPVTFGVGAPNETELEPRGPVNFFTARFDVDGGFSWARLAPSEGYQVLRDAAILDDGSVFLAGRFSRSMTLFAGEPVETTFLDDPVGWGDLFLARLAGPRLGAGNQPPCSAENPGGACPGGQACAGGSCRPTCDPGRFECGPDLAHSNLPGVRIEFPAQFCCYTLSEVSAGIVIDYDVVVEQDLPGVASLPSGAERCGAAGPASNLSVREWIYGGEQRYCLCDMGLCPGGAPRERDLRRGTFPARFPWDGRNWNGPSDTNNPPGPPFPPGVYTFEVRAEGTFRTSIGAVPFEAVGRFGIELLPD